MTRCSEHVLYNVHFQLASHLYLDDFCLQATCLTSPVVRFQTRSLNSSCWRHIFSYHEALNSMYWTPQWRRINLKTVDGLLTLHVNSHDWKLQENIWFQETFQENSIKLPKNLPLLTSASDLCAQHHTPPGEHGKAFSADSTPELNTQFSSQYPLLSHIKCVHTMLAGELCNDNSECTESFTLYCRSNNQAWMMINENNLPIIRGKN